MGGLLILAILVGWFYLVKTISSAVVDKMAEGFKKTLVLSLTFIILLSAPVMDEIIGGFQFRALCAEQNIVIYDEDKLKNNVLIVSPVSSVTTDEYLVSLRQTDMGGRDAKTGELLLQYTKNKANGGWISRLMGRTSQPITFNRVCGIKDELNLLQKTFNMKFEYR
jgi:hypothetical protein